jgi:transcription initiation factor TFIIB
MICSPFPLTIHLPHHQRKLSPGPALLRALSKYTKDLCQDKIFESIKQKCPEPAEPDHMVIVKEEEDKKTSALGRPPAKRAPFLVSQI